jgi:hypothetical protein
MSVQSLNGQFLTLGDLTISNERFSRADGYVASSAGFYSNLTGTSLTAPYLNMENGVVIQSSAGDILNISSASIGIINGAFGTSLYVPASNELSISGGQGKLIAGTYSGGIGALVEVLSIPTLTSNASANLPNQQIPEFIGTSGSAYTATVNGPGYNSLVFTVSFVSATSTETTVAVSVTNLGNSSFTSGPVKVSIMGLN